MLAQTWYCSYGLSVENSELCWETLCIWKCRTKVLSLAVEVRLDNSRTVPEMWTSVDSLVITFSDLFYGESVPN